MRDGLLIRLRSRALPLLLAGAALAVGLLGPTPVARAKLDPLNIITVQIQRANIMVVLDTSGSMAFRPEDDETVGGDCYQGANCVTTALPRTCTDGQTCAAANTCLDGYSGCTTGVNSYCADGTRCLPGRLCGSGANLTVCPTTTTTCRDGSNCGHLCTDGTSVCNTDADCPQVHGTCAGRCRGSTSAAATCTPSDLSNCPATRFYCVSEAGNDRCRATSGSGWSCGSDGDCWGGGDCGGTGTDTCRWYPADGNCNSANECRQCVMRCANSTSTSCTTDNDCPVVANTCNLSTTACAASTGSTTCGYWCNDGTQCAASSSFCTSVTGVVTACTQVCNDGGSCYPSMHCGTGGCPSTSNVYQGSSRMAIAKHSITNVMSETKNIASFGFMTFNQTGYFPYRAGSTVLRKYAEFLDENWLKSHGGWDHTNRRPLAQFTADGRTYTIECAGSGASYAPSPCTAVGTTVYSSGGGGTFSLPGGNSEYERRGHHWGWGWDGRRQVRMDYCGAQCRSGGRTWNYRGSYYTYDRAVSTGTTYSFQTTYQGQSYTVGATTYTYFEFPYDYNGYDGAGTGFCSDSNGTAPVCAYAGASSCSNASGDRADGVLRTMPSLSDTQSVQDANVTSINAWLAPQNSGGVVSRSGTPTGCTLQYAGSGTTTPTPAGAYYDAYSAMAALKAADPAAACRKNAVLLVTDGEPNGPGDCSTSACTSTGECGSAQCATADLSGCSCKAVKAAKHMFDDLGVKTYAVGFGAQTTGSATLDNIAKAGGSPLRSDGHYAFYAIRESDLVDSLRAAVYEAAKGDYTTSAPTVATSSSTSSGAVAGDYALLASSEFPSFRGHLRAFQTIDENGNVLSPPTKKWDAGEKLASRTWNTRKVFTSSSSNTVVPFLDASSQPNAAALYALGLGASEAEAGEIVKWTLGYGRPWPLGALLNSTPMTHGEGMIVDLPGHKLYMEGQDGRPKMVYAGADDGMLHAFYLENGASWSGGDEAWAYVPPDLLPTLAAIYANGGQTSDPRSHHYGVNSSPKVSDVCGGSCATPSDWKTVLVSGEGPGGKGYFVLDLSALPNAAQPFSVLWHSAWVSAFAGTLGQSWSVPAFAYVGSPLRSVLLFGSGYDLDAGDGQDQGAYLHLVNALTGVALTGAPHHLAAPSSPVTTYAVVADTAVAMSSTTFLPVAAYQADLGGRVWRLADGSAAPGSTPLLDSGTAHPYYYSPAVVIATGRTVYLALNDSTTDDPDVSGGGATPFATIFKDDDGTKVNLTLSASGNSYTNSVPLTSLCKTGCVAGTCSCANASDRFTAAARPASSPLLLQNCYGLSADACRDSPTVQALFLIYQPPTAPCALGKSHVVVLDVTDVPITQSAVLDAGDGKASGLFVGAGGQIIVAKSGTGSGSASLSVLTQKVDVQPQAGSIVPIARVVGQVEKDD